MDFVNQISSKVLAFGDQIGGKLGVLFFPAVLVSAILLLCFARYSYKLLNVVLPLSCVASGAVVGANHLAPVLAEKFGFIGQIANIEFLAGFLVAAVFGLIALKSRALGVLIMGTAIGYLTVGALAKDILLSVDYVRELATQAGGFKATVVGILICIICMLATAYILLKFFNSIYIVATTIFVATAALALVAIFICGSSPMAPVIILGASALGFVFGSYCCHEQWYDVDFI